MTRPDFTNIVRQAWRVDFDGSHMYKLIKKTQLLKMKAKEWNKHTFGNIFIQMKKLDEDLLKLQSDTTNLREGDLREKQMRLITKKRKMTH